MKKRAIHPLAVLYLCGILSAAIYAFFMPHPLLDTREYDDAMAYHFSSDAIKFNPFNIDQRWMFPTRRTIGFPLILKYVGMPVTAVILMISGVIGPFVLWEKLKPSIPNTRLESFYWLLWVTFPLQAYYSGFMMPEMLTQFLVLLWFLGMLSGNQKRVMWTLSALILLKPVFMVLVVPVFWQNIETKIVHKTAIGLWILPLVTVIGIISGNHKKWGIAHVSSVSTTNSYEYNRYLILKSKKGTVFADSVYHSESLVLNTMSNFDPKKGEWLNQKTRDTYLEFPFTALGLHIKGIFQMFLDPGRYDAMVFFDWKKTQGFLGVKDGADLESSQRPWWEWSYILFFGIIQLLKFLLLLYVVVRNRGMLWRMKDGNYELRIIMITVIIYGLAIGAVGSARYLIPLYPLIVYALVKYFPQNTYENPVAE